MFNTLKDTNQIQWRAEAFSKLPKMAMTPSAAYQQMVLGKVASVPLKDLGDCVLATSVVPYPPGIPLLMPGEAAGKGDGPHIQYSKALEEWDRTWPGFGHDTHGVENREGVYHVQCLNAER